MEDAEARFVHFYMDTETDADVDTAAVGIAAVIVDFVAAVAGKAVTVNVDVAVVACETGMLVDSLEPV